MCCTADCYAADLAVQALSVHDALYAPCLRLTKWAAHIACSCLPCWDQARLVCHACMLPSWMHYSCMRLLSCLHTVLAHWVSGHKRLVFFGGGLHRSVALLRWPGFEAVQFVELFVPVESTALQAYARRCSLSAPQFSAVGSRWPRAHCSGLLLAMAVLESLLAGYSAPSTRAGWLGPSPHFGCFLLGLALNFRACAAV
jgi:hypothetical protein